MKYTLTTTDAGTTVYRDGLFVVQFSRQGHAESARSFVLIREQLERESGTAPLRDDGRTWRFGG